MSDTDSREARTGIRAVPGELKLFGFPPTPARIEVVDHPPPERAMRALRALGLFWGIAILCVFIPIAHFVLVPAFLVTGVVVGIRRLREETTLVATHGLCPRCAVERTFEVSGRLRTHARALCVVCHNELDLSVGASSGGEVSSA